MDMARLAGMLIAATIALPPVTGGFDYQLGGSYRPAPGTSIVARDSTARPAPGTYGICYVNGFQTQPGQRHTWPDRLLLHRRGRLVHDPGWPGEILLDTSTAARRTAIARHLSARLSRCRSVGFAAVEFDNLDSWTRSHRLLTRADNVAAAVLLVRRAHRLGLATAQKNTPQLGTAGRRRIGFDFAVSEECVRYRECSAYTKVYGRGRVLDIEYAGELPMSWARVCASRNRPTRTILRDHDLLPAGAPGHVSRTCPVR